MHHRMSLGPDRTRYGTLLHGVRLHGHGFPLGHSHDHDDDHAYGDEHGRRSGKAAGRRDVLITTFDKGPEAPGIRTRIFKLRHAHDFSCSGRW